MKLLLDTCAILWAVAEPERMTSHARNLLTLESSEIYYSPISASEIACGADRGRFVLDRHWKTWFRYFASLNGWKEATIDLTIMEEVYSLPDQFHPDPADRIIVATARIHDMTVVTSDRKILDYPHVESVA